MANAAKSAGTPISAIIRARIVPSILFISLNCSRRSACRQLAPIPGWVSSLRSAFIPSPLSHDPGPVVVTSELDASGFGADGIPGVAAGVEDVVVARPQAVREEPLFEIQPEPFDRVELG